MKSETYESQSKLIAALADSIKNTDWSSDVLKKCSVIKDALKKLENLANNKINSEK